MKLQNVFTVPVPVEEAWRALLDVEQIAPCLPGATVEAVQGDDVVGRVHVKLGPIALTYRGVLTFVERDQQAGRVVMLARAREARGSGTADATITTVVTAVDGDTRVSVDTDLDLTGKPAQFGRGVLQDVSGNLVQQFAASLADELGRGGLGSDEPAAQQEHLRPTPDPIDLLDVAGLSAPRPAFAAGAMVGLVVGWLLGRRG